MCTGSFALAAAVFGRGRSATAHRRNARAFADPTADLRRVPVLAQHIGDE